MTAILAVPVSGTPSPTSTLQPWAKRWLSRWHLAGGRSKIDAAGALVIDHLPPLHMSAYRAAQTTPAIASALLGELQGTVGGRQAVTAAAIAYEANVANVCRNSPSTALIVAARDWLEAYRDAGGSWVGTNERPQLFITEGADADTLRRMQDALFEDPQLAKTVRGQIVMEWWESAATPSEMEGR